MVSGPWFSPDRTEKRGDGPSGAGSKYGDATNVASREAALHDGDKQGRGLFPSGPLKVDIAASGCPMPRSKVSKAVGFLGRANDFRGKYGLARRMPDGATATAIQSARGPSWVVCVCQAEEADPHKMPAIFSRYCRDLTQTFADRRAPFVTGDMTGPTTTSSGPHYATNAPADADR